MLKNLLYSLLFHFLLLLVIYVNFNLKESDTGKTSEIAVSLISLSGSKNSNQINQSKSIKSDKKTDDSKAKIETTKKPQSQQKSPQDKVKEQPKKLKKSKIAETTNKPVEELKDEEYKTPDQQPEKQKEAEKISKDQELNKELDNEENEITEQEKDLGSKQKFDQEQEATEKKDVKTSDYSDMANSMENIDLSTREKVNIQSQLKGCYRRILSENPTPTNLKLFIHIHIEKDGYISYESDDLIDIDRYNNPKESNYKIAVDNIHRALDLCSPLRNLPLDKYDTWKDVILEFDDAKEREQTQTSQ